MQDQIGQPGLVGVLSDERPAMRAAGLGSFTGRSADCLVSGYGNLRFLDAELEALRKSSGGAVALMKAWSVHGVRLLEQLDGDFALALWDMQSQTGIIAVDRFATHAVYWGQDSKAVAFANRPEQVTGELGLSNELNPNAVLAYAHFHVIPAPICVYNNVSRLDCGQAVRVSGAGVELIRYWRPEFSESKPFKFEAEKDDFLSAIEQGVQLYGGDYSPEEVGCFLSGGTDSSTISGMYSRAFDTPARTFSIGFQEAQYDESEYARLASSHFGTKHTEHRVTADELLQAIATISSTYEQPFGNSSAVPTFVCAQVAAEQGIKLMLGGDGGDELYGGNKRYSTARILDLYRHVPSFLRRHALERLSERGGWENSVYPMRKLMAYVDQAKLPMPERIQARYNLLNRLGPSSVFSPGFLNDTNQASPASIEKSVWDETGDYSMLNRMLAYDFKFTLGDNDLPKVTRMCNAAGVSVAFPMLSNGVVEHSLQLDPRQKIVGTELRHFFRKSLRGFLPDKIIDKSKHGFGMPFGEWLLHQPALKAMADDSLRSLENRRILNREFSTEIRSHLESGHPGYFGIMIWIMMMLELWLRESCFADLRWER